MRGRLLAVGVCALSVVSACGGDDPLPGTNLPGGSGGYSTPARARHVYVRMPEDARTVEHLYEGAGLVRQIPREDMNDEANWWLAFLDQAEVETFQRAGAEVRELSQVAPGLGVQSLDPTDTCTATPGSNTFCSYDTTIPRCTRSISQEIDAVATDYPPLGGVTYASSFTLSTTEGGRPIKAVRIGKHWVSGGGGAVPQMIVYAAQHAREWGSVELTMRVMRYLAQSYEDNTNGVRALLANTAVVFVPVANPDGYAFTHSSTGIRNWRPNRSVCANGAIGTDPNRNFYTTWDEAGADDTCVTNENSTYRGDERGTEKETLALDILGIFGGGSGSYATRLGVNTHNYGNHLMYPEGISAGLSPCTTTTNCTAPDLGAFYKLVQNGVNARMTDEESGVPYNLGSISRALYATSGDSATRHAYTIPRFMTVSGELMYTLCGFRAEQVPAAQLTALTTNWRNFLVHLIGQVPALYSGTFFDPFTLPHIHRRQMTGVGGELPTWRIGVRKTLASPAFYHSAGTSFADEAQTGAAYNMIRWRPEVPYAFPTQVSVCATGTSCRYARLAAPSGVTSVNLCSSSRFSGTGFTWQPDLSSSPKQECFWKFTRTGATPHQLTSQNWGFPSKSRLIFSNRWRSARVTAARVLVSDNGFVGCSTSTGTGCRIVRQFPFGSSNYDLRSTYHGYRTEIVDVSDFDNHTAQVRFEVLSSSATLEDESFDIVDPVVVGLEASD